MKIIVKSLQVIKLDWTNNNNAVKKTIISFSIHKASLRLLSELSAVFFFIILRVSVSKKSWPIHIVTNGNLVYLKDFIDRQKNIYPLRSKDEQEKGSEQANLSKMFRNSNLLMYITFPRGWSLVSTYYTYSMITRQKDCNILRVVDYLSWYILFRDLSVL